MKTYQVLMTASTTVTVEAESEEEAREEASIPCIEDWDDVSVDDDVVEIAGADVKSVTTEHNPDGSVASFTFITLP